VANPDGPPPLHSDDPGDDYLLALAARERTPLVSGDAHVLALSDKLPISSPRAFLEQLERSLLRGCWEDSSVETPATRQPLHRLASDAGDRVEVPVVVEESRAVHLGDCCDEEIDRSRATVLASPCERCLCSKRDPLDLSIDRKMRQQAQIICETIVFSAAPR